MLGEKKCTDCWVWVVLEKVIYEHIAVDSCVKMIFIGNVACFELLALVASPFFSEVCVHTGVQVNRNENWFVFPLPVASAASIRLGVARLTKRALLSVRLVRTFSSRSTVSGETGMLLVRDMVHVSIEYCPPSTANAVPLQKRPSF